MLFRILLFLLQCLNYLSKKDLMNVVITPFEVWLIEQLRQKASKSGLLTNPVTQ